MLLLVMVGMLLALVWIFQGRLIYLPDRGPVPPAGEVIEGGRDVRLETSDGLTLNAWFFPAGASENDITLLVANGNAGDRSLRAPLAQAVTERGLSVLLFDYRGYGENPGHPSEDGLALDARAAYRFLVEEMGIARERLIYFGESLGAAVVTGLALEHPPGGLVLRSPFTDLAAIGRIHYPFLPVRALLRDRFPLAEQVGRVTVPTTVVYGTRDSIVPPEQSRAVAKVAAGPTTIVEVRGAHHNDLALLSGPQLIDAILQLRDRISGPT